MLREEPLVQTQRVFVQSGLWRGPIRLSWWLGDMRRRKIVQVIDCQRAPRAQSISDQGRLLRTEPVHRFSLTVVVVHLNF